MIPLSVLVVPKIAAPLQCITSSKLQELPYLRDLTLAHPIMKRDSQFDISLLIGVDYYWKIVEDDIVRGDGPTAVQSKLGYLLSGQLVLLTYSNIAQACTLALTVNMDMRSKCLKNFGNRIQWNISHNKNSDKFMNTYLNSVTRQENGSYIVKIPLERSFPITIKL